MEPELRGEGLEGSVTRDEGLETGVESTETMAEGTETKEECMDLKVEGSEMREEPIIDDMAEIDPGFWLLGQVCYTTSWISFEQIQIPSYCKLVSRYCQYINKDNAYFDELIDG